MSSKRVSNYLWNIICRNRKSILQLKSMHHTHHMYNIIWICNITQCHCSFLYDKQEQILKRAQICKFTQVKHTISLPTRTLSEVFIRSFVCNMKRPSVKQSIKWQVSFPPPPFETARAQSELFAFPCGQWEPIWKSQIIGRYKEIPLHTENM